MFAGSLIFNLAKIQKENTWFNFVCVVKVNINRDREYTCREKKNPCKQTQKYLQWFDSSSQYYKIIKNTSVQHECIKLNRILL